jgi:hypothetical protein
LALREENFKRAGTETCPYNLRVRRHYVAKILISDFLTKGLDKTLIFDYAYISQLSGNSSAVERNLAKVDVAGSNPVSRSIWMAA